jgi:hypothetical protein
MIKSLDKTDVLNTPFQAIKNWEVNNIDPSDLILWMSQSIDLNSGITSSLTGDISLTYIDYGDNSPGYPITNSNCNIALQQQTEGYVTYRKGTVNPNVLYPTSSFYTSNLPNYDAKTNPQNIDRTYTNLIYIENQHLFYNNYNNFTQTFGMESADLSTTNRLLTNTMDVFTVPQNKFGNKIVPRTVFIVDDSLDKPYTIIDDGNCNLIFSGSVFSTIEIDTLLNSIQKSLNASIYSYDVTGSISDTISNLVFNTFGALSRVSSSVISSTILGGIAPYDINWYVVGDYSGLWTLTSTTGPNTRVTYNNVVSATSPVYYTNTYIVCLVTDTADNQIFSNLIYLSSGSIPFVPTPITGSPIPTSSAFNPPPAPPTNEFLHIVNTGINTGTDNSGNKYDESYLLYNYVPDPNVVVSIAGQLTDLTPSSSYTGIRNGLWYTPDTSIANWISPISPLISGFYGNEYAGNFTYRIYFDLVTPNNVAINPSGFVLNGNWTVDDTGSILINGSDTGIRLTSGSVPDFESLYSFSITGGFVSGRNYIDFNLWNIWPSGSTIYGTFANSTGLLVEFDPTNALILTGTPPSEINQSSDTTVVVGSPISLYGNFAGSQPISYQWYFDDNIIANANSSTYTKPFSQFSDVGSYTLSASNAFGNASTAPINLSVINPQLPQVTFAPPSGTTINTASVYINCPSYPFVTIYYSYTVFYSNGFVFNSDIITGSVGAVTFGGISSVNVSQYQIANAYASYNGYINSVPVFGYWPGGNILG